MREPLAGPSEPVSNGTVRPTTRRTPASTLRTRIVWPGRAYAIRGCTPRALTAIVTGVAVASGWAALTGAAKSATPAAARSRQRARRLLIGPHHRTLRHGAAWKILT